QSYSLHFVTTSARPTTNSRQWSAVSDKKNRRSVMKHCLCFSSKRPSCAGGSQQHSTVKERLTFFCGQPLGIIGSFHHPILTLELEFGSLFFSGIQTFSELSVSVRNGWHFQLHRLFGMSSGNSPGLTPRRGDCGNSTHKLPATGQPALTNSAGFS